MQRLVRLGLTGLAICAGAPALAADWLVVDDPAPAAGLGYVHLGGIASHEADDGQLWVGGVPVPGADFVTELTFGLALEAGVKLGDMFAISVSGTTPMTTSNVGTGTLTGVGNLGNGTVGYYALTGHVHLPLGDRITPYFGGGVGYMHVFGTEDGAIADLTINPAAGGVLQAGIDFAINENFGLFVDAKQFFISTDVTGFFGPAPVLARTRVDPWVLSAGVSFNF